MKQLIIKSTERKPTALVSDRSGDYLFGHVVRIADEFVDLSGYDIANFLIVQVATDDDLDWLLEPLFDSTPNNPEDDHGDLILKRRRKVRVDKLAGRLRNKLFSSGIVKINARTLHSIIEDQGV